METLDGLKADVGFDDVLYDDQIGKVSVIGVSMRSIPVSAPSSSPALADVGVNIEMISTSEIRISVIVDQDDVDRAVVAAHLRWDWMPPKRRWCTPVPAAERSSTATLVPFSSSMSSARSGKPGRGCLAGTVHAWLDDLWDGH